MVIVPAAIVLLISVLMVLLFRLGSQASEGPYWRLLSSWSIGRTVVSLAFGPNMTALAVGLNDGTIQLKRVSDDALLHTLKGHSGAVKGLAFSPDGTILASYADDIDVTIRLW